METTILNANNLTNIFLIIYLVLDNAPKILTLTLIS